MTQDIDSLAYTDFISLIREENRPPGGKKTVREFLLNSFVDKDSKVLEVGCTNGFTSLEVARTLNCQVWGVDINRDSLKNAQLRVKDEKVTFSYGNAYNLPFEDNFFDLLICSNATSFMNQKEKAFGEYCRVTKNWGFIGVCPMYYLTTPPKEVVENVFKEINVPITITSKDYWLSLFKGAGLEVYYVKDYRFAYKTQEEIEDYVTKCLNKPHLRNLVPEVRNKISNRWKRTMGLFNENLKYVGYSVILLRKRNELEEAELFDAVEAENGN
jgi:ubiquinone/menaquinone biosynthesis C-methylase UbiE